jgi:hypothetical protein
MELSLSWKTSARIRQLCAGQDLMCGWGLRTSCSQVDRLGKKKTRVAEKIRGAAMRVLNLRPRRFGELHEYNQARMLLHFCNYSVKQRP